MTRQTLEILHEFAKQKRMHNFFNLTKKIVSMIIVSVFAVLIVYRTT